MHESTFDTAYFGDLGSWWTCLQCEQGCVRCRQAFLGRSWTFSLFFDINFGSPCPKMAAVAEIRHDFDMAGEKIWSLLAPEDSLGEGCCL
jgi:hypothetical protein